MIRAAVQVTVAVVLAFVVGFVVMADVARADETSATDKLRILYSTRFTFTDDGLPLVTVEIMGNRREVKLRAKGGIVVRPDGPGGSRDRERWRRRLDDHRRECQAGADRRTGPWSRRCSPMMRPGSTAALARWKDRGFDPQTFEIGTVFGVDGEVIDTRETRIAIDPVAAGKGTARAAELAQRFGIPTSVHQELVRRPAGTIVAQERRDHDQEPVGAVVHADAGRPRP